MQQSETPIECSEPTTRTSATNSKVPGSILDIIHKVNSRASYGSSVAMTTVLCTDESCDTHIKYRVSKRCKVKSTIVCQIEYQLCMRREEDTSEISYDNLLTTRLDDYGNSITHIKYSTNIRLYMKEEYEDSIIVIICRDMNGMRYKNLADKFFIYTYVNCSEAPNRTTDKRLYRLGGCVEDLLMNHAHMEVNSIFVHTYYSGQSHELAPLVHPPDLTQYFDLTAVDTTIHIVIPVFSESVTINVHGTIVFSEGPFNRARRTSIVTTVISRQQSPTSTMRLSSRKTLSIEQERRWASVLSFSLWLWLHIRYICVMLVCRVVYKCISQITIRNTYRFNRSANTLARCPIVVYILIRNCEGADGYGIALLFILLIRSNR